MFIISKDGNAVLFDTGLQIYVEHKQIKAHLRQEPIEIDSLSLGTYDSPETAHSVFGRMLDDVSAGVARVDMRSYDEVEVG